MSYKEGIIHAITELKDRNGSSMIAIKKHLQGNLPKDKKWINGTFLKVLKTGVANGEFVQIKNSYKLSPEFKKKVGKKPAAVAKKTTTTKKAPAKAVPKKKATAKAVSVAFVRTIYCLFIAVETGTLMAHSSFFLFALQTVKKAKSAPKKKATAVIKTSTKKAAPKKATATKKKTAAKKKSAKKE
jgi:histone H1/5